MRVHHIIGFLPLLFAVSAPKLLAAGADVADSADYPDIGRFEGSRIAYYRVADFDAYTVITGPVKREGQVEQAHPAEGRVTRIAYHLQADATPLEIARNFEDKLTGAGYQTLYSCAAKECGQNSFRYTTEVIPVPFMDVDSWKFHYLAARRQRPEGDIYATVLSSVSGNGEKRIQLVVVEEQGMQNRMVDAVQMAKGISADGHIALYNIYFDTDRAELKADSRPALQEIASLLQQDPRLSLLVVGHTDNVGTLDYNEQLSRRRAVAVVDALVAEHGIDSGRLSAAGVGMYAPVSSNRSEEGRRLNRRVELVER